MSTLQDFYRGYSPVKVSRKNLLYNGCFRINQYGTVHQAVIGNTNAYYIDRWKFQANDGSFIFQTSFDRSIGEGKAANWYGVQVNTAWDSTASADHYVYAAGQKLEGYDVQFLRGGGKLTLSFDVKSSTPGIHTVNIVCESTLATSGAYSILKEYTINEADTWEYKTITIEFPDAQMEITDNEKAITLILGVQGTADDRQGSPDVWTDDTLEGKMSTNSVFWATTVGNYIRFANVQLEEGENASPFEHRQYEEELALCQRYFYKGGSIGHGYGYLTSSSAGGLTNYAAQFFSFPVTMRDTPTATILSEPSYTNCSFGSWQIYSDGAMLRVTAAALDRQYRAASGSFSFDAEL